MVLAGFEESVVSTPLRALIMSSRLEVVPSVVSGAVLVFAGGKAQHKHKAHENTQNSFFHFYHHSFKNICFNILCAFCAVIIEYIISRTKSRVSPKYERTKYGRAVDF